uniref:Uncharacterized protein n=1 Tax=Solanum tuberosum TaxID=4113 RepID=M1DZ99_SOLTU
MGWANRGKAVVDWDDEDPLSGARVEEDLEAVRKRMGIVYADFIMVPPNTALEVEMLRRQLHRERKKGLERNRLMTWIRKTIKAIFSCVSPDREIPRLDPEDYMDFSMLNEDWAGENPLKDLASDTDTSPSQGS